MMRYEILENILNAYLQLDPQSFQRLEEIEGQMVEVTLTDLSITFFLFFKKNGIQIFSQKIKEPVTIIESKSIHFLSSALVEINPKHIQIHGNVEIGYEVYGLFKNIEIDWEEQLSHYTGDIIAHQIGKFARNFLSSCKNTNEILCENVKEYVQEEARLLPSQQEVKDFCEEVERLRQQFERIQAYLLQAGYIY